MITSQVKWVTDKTPVIFYIPANTAVDINGSKSVLVKTRGYEKLRINVRHSVLADGSIHLFFLF
jgi:hypothetical protein